MLKVDLRALKLPEEQSITYHYTCHLRGIGVKDEGVRLLRQIGNVDFKPMEKTDQCCGFGGTFAIKYPAISGAIVEDKVQCIADTSARDAGLQRRRLHHEHLRHVPPPGHGRADEAHRRVDRGGDGD